MMKVILFLAPIVMSIVFMGCTNPASTPTSTQLAKIDITNAKTLFIAPSGSGIRATSTTNKLFKITAEGYVQEVTYLDETGKTTTTSSAPTAVYNANSDYIVVCFFSDGYLVRKSDGAVYSLSSIGVPTIGINGFKNDPIIKSDSSSNIYYRSNSSIMKINISNPTSLSSSKCSVDIDVPDNFIVTPEGHVAYAYPDTSSQLVTRIRKTNGGLYNLNAAYTVWIGLDNKIKYLPFASNSVGTVSIDTSMTVSLSQAVGTLAPVYEYNGYLLKMLNRTLIVCPDSVNEVENILNVPKQITIPQIKTINKAVKSDNYYYLSGSDLSGNPILLKVDQNTDSVTTLLPISGVYYDILKMSVSIDDKITFNALRMSDGAKIIGEISSTGSLTILDEIINSEVIMLERIN